ncbi:DNA replication and repair protein RecF [Fervidobacterium changbaicum]|uniref:DNA replication and repair protein RecF n=1 Tax=Fervidobacterium changbaicum TaxID=310769 RepID=A0ABX5QS01_9BACT|nr:DNA replication and repair protein RecF [Fervidobacterium changbaicum]QAV33204.1 DNA replication and repair protein RecF [Fervidobacterium changbaicum]SDH77694.1 DNA replication and repair protein RecF [Fervidobacterium changbaicum]
MEKKKMVIKELTVKNFRNFSEHTVQFSDGINVIYGPNGSGKTSVLEAVAYLSNPRSFRGARDYQILKMGEKHFEIKGRIVSGDEKHTIEIVYVQEDDKKEKVAYLDGSKVKRFRDIQEVFIAIPFSFRDYSMVDGGPAQRREFFDEIFSLLDLDYYETLRAYEKLLDERNEYLKQDPSMINREYLIETAKDLQIMADKIVEKREQMVQELSEYLDKIFRIEYKSDFKGKNFLDYIDQDIAEQVTTIGPHSQDDYLLYYKELLARHYASEGQKRLLYLSIVLAFKKLIEETKHYEPVFLFDEPFNVLDTHLLEKFISNLSGQVIIASITPLLGAHNIGLSLGE